MRTKHILLKDASALVKEVNTTKFDASVDLHIRLGVDPKKADQAIRGTVTFRMVPVKQKKYWYFVGPTRKQLQKAPVLTLLVWMNLYKRLKVAGQMLTLSLPLLL